MTYEDDFTWVDPLIIPDAAHLLHHSDVWCVVNDEGKVLVFKMGTEPNDANSPQCNKSRIMMERVAPRYAKLGAVGVKKVDHLFLPDSPGRYTDERVPARARRDQ